MDLNEEIAHAVEILRIPPKEAKRLARGGRLSGASIFARTLVIWYAREVRKWSYLEIAAALRMHHSSVRSRHLWAVPVEAAGGDFSELAKRLSNSINPF